MAFEPRTVRRLGPDSVEAAHALVAACGRALAAGGWRNWDPPYPLERMRAEAASREVYLVSDGDEPLATFTIGTVPPHAYPHEIFSPAVCALYLNRLAVAPTRWRSGLGRACMAEVEARARAAGCRAVRFDAFADNAPLRAFYHALGYGERGPFVVEGTISVICFEKEVA